MAWEAFAAESDELLVDGGAGDQRFPHIASLTGDGYVIVWADGSQVRAQRFDASGAKVGAEIAVGSGDISDVVTLPGGGFGITYSGGSLRYATFDPEGQRLADVELASAASSPGGSYLSPLSDNAFIAWYEGSELKGRLASEPFAFTLTSNPAATTAFAALGSASDGRVMFVGSDGNGRLITPSGAPVGTIALSLAPDVQSLAAAGLADGSAFVVVWTDTAAAQGDASGFGIKAILINPVSGGALGPAFLVNSQTGGDQVQPTVTALSWGGFLVSWVDEGADGTRHDVKAQLFNGAGVRIGEEFLVSGPVNEFRGTADALAYPEAELEVTELANGELAFTWSRGQTEPDIVTRIFTPNLTGTAGIEEIHGTRLADTIIGLAGNDALFGHDGNDIIDGGPGADAMAGGAGNDLYIVDDAGDVVTEAANAGTDEIRTALGDRAVPVVTRYVLPANVEILSGTLGRGQSLEDNEGNNVITTGAGADLIVVRNGGNDTVSTGAGADFVFFGATFNTLDSVDAGGGGGRDKLGLHGDYALTLGADSLKGVEKLVMWTSGDPGNDFDYSITTHDGNVAAGTQLEVVALSLSAAETLVFNGAAETNGSFWVRSGAGADTITGGAMGDRLTGGAGRDTINGGGGNDRITGGAGGDYLSGGAGADRFELTNAADSVGTEYDVITGFDFSQDVINVAEVPFNVVYLQGEVRWDFAASLDSTTNLGAQIHEQFAVGNAVLLFADSGELAGKTFYLQNVPHESDMEARYTHGIDLVIELVAPTNMPMVEEGFPLGVPFIV